MTAWQRLLAAATLALSLGGCAVLSQFAPAVELESMTPGEYIAQQRGDLLTTGRLSALTQQTIRVAGLETEGCAASRLDCIRAMEAATGLADERRLSALSELWLQQAMLSGEAATDDDARLQAWMEAARHAYAYLFFSGRPPEQRVFEDRQTQVRDWYNQAVQEATTLLFEGDRPWVPETSPAETAPLGRLQRAGWVFRIDLSSVRLPEGVTVPEELLSASSLSFKGLHNTWRRNGFGAELVAVMGEDPVTSAAPAAPAGDGKQARHRRPAWSEMPSPGMTVLFHFRGHDLAELLAQQDVRVSVHDPYVQDSIELHGYRVPLAANFTAGYGLWLARSGFNRQSLRTLFGRGRSIDRPHLYMMQPYDPERRIILMLHGLASSPEAWVNVANEIQGDDELRRNFQIWQVYYPTNMPVVVNHFAIRRLVARTLANFDPDGRAPASRDMVLVGHSMGGVIGRLMVSSADEQLWTWADEAYPAEMRRLERFRPRLDPVLRFEPMPQIERAVFIATPHRGTAVAGNRLGRWISRLVRLPLTLLENFAEILQVMPEALAEQDTTTSRPLPNSIDNLDANDPFVRVAADLPMSPAVRYHSIIAQLDASQPLDRSDDGLVPYRSAHLAGAVSEKVIVSGHSVQETAPAILELRRILHQDLEAMGGRAPQGAD
ncbi:esterase/lipase family protein [Stenotrophomonas mori]|uniref:Alpha/beta fold hydrolase n=1 Tax=Stenotrophomonas mori TaxID=2871096 RepID=A0ABT0SGM4_9GAMM|nr:alpha/beta fold hydrolase [Stenotrophomonas mori]MCL7714140.1 alpha/beta fold hydrolase [Stenotrophomonas mori]